VGTNLAGDGAARASGILSAFRQGVRKERQQRERKKIKRTKATNKEMGHHSIFPLLPRILQKTRAAPGKTRHSEVRIYHTRQKRRQKKGGSGTPGNIKYSKNGHRKSQTPVGKSTGLGNLIDDKGGKVQAHTVLA